jgi:hypothetical protein
VCWENYPFKNLPEAVSKGLIREDDIDRSLMRVLVGRFDLGRWIMIQLYPGQNPPIRH